MLDEGTPTRDYRYIAELVDGLGGTLETFSNRESSELILKLLKTDFTTGLDLLAELLNESHFPPDRLELTRSQLLTHVAALDDRPTTSARRSSTVRCLPAAYSPPRPRDAGHHRASPERNSADSIAGTTPRRTPSSSSPEMSIPPARCVK